MDTSFPSRRRAGSPPDRTETPSSVSHPSAGAMADAQPRTRRPPPHLREPRAFMDETPTWHLWGMMVGFMAAGAAILIILSLKAG